MDAKADEATREDVDILIFDYLLCTAIYTAINSEHSNTNMSWAENTIRGLRKGLPAVDELPTTLQIKVHILETVRAIKDADGTGSTTLAETATKLLSSCKSAGLEDIETYATAVASQLSAQAAVKAHQIARDHHGRDALSHRTSPLETQRPRSPSCVTAQHPIHQLRPTHETLVMLSNIMQLLDPPVLLQLERGKLEGLSRAETLQLKQRIGME